MKQGNVIVTGATGFVGKDVARRLESEGYSVTRFSKSLGNDITKPDAFNGFPVEGVDAVFHIAGATSVPQSWNEPSLFYEINTMGTQRVLDYCRLVKAKMIYTSAYVYGTPKYLPIDEKHPVCPNNPYAHSKWLGEELCRFYSDNLGVPCTIFRPFNIYGPGMAEHWLFPSLIRQLKSGKIIVKDAEPRRDYIHIDDYAEACVLSLKTNTRVSLFNAGSGRSYSVKDVIEIIIAASGREVVWENQNERRQNEVMDTVSDTSALKKTLGWEPKIGLGNGLSELVGLAL